MKQLVIILSVMVVFSSCTDDNTSGPKVIEWPNRTQKEDCIEILRMTYEYRNIDKYQEIMLQPESESDYYPEGYIWYNTSYDALEYGASYDYDQDLLGTREIFEKLQDLRLRITEKEWSELNEFRGEPCSDCWIISGLYNIFGYWESEDMRFIASGLVRFTIGPDRSDANKYLIYEAADINFSSCVEPGVNPVGGLSINLSAMEWAWGRLKGFFMPE
jgi:hypothetical protein